MKSLIMLILVISVFGNVSEANAKAKSNKITKHEHTQTKHVNSNHKAHSKKSSLSKVRHHKETNSKEEFTVEVKLKGMASWYGHESGNRTASGARFEPMRLTAAHRTLPFGTKVRVTNLKNDRSVVVVINDRGPFVRGRIIDLSKGAAKSIGMNGTGPVQLAILD